MRILLDNHLPRKLASALRARGLNCLTLSEWEGGKLREAVDADIIAEAEQQGWILITYGTSTIPALIRRLATDGREHAGVLLVSSKTMRSNDIGGLARAIEAELRGADLQNWRNRVQYLRPR